jgi:hypothetical protein
MTSERAVESRVERGSVEEGGAMGGKGGDVERGEPTAVGRPKGAAVKLG